MAIENLLDGKCSQTHKQLSTVLAAKDSYCIVLINLAG